MGVNHLAHFVLTLRLLPLLRSSAASSHIGARIVNVSSIMHIFARLRTDEFLLRKRYSATTAYANSKCAQVLFTCSLRRVLREEPVHVFAVHPGEVMTDIARNIPSLLFRAQAVIMPIFLFTPAQGPAPALTASVSVHQIVSAPRAHYI
jgi:NAD(P)-dependent dehydrogenase (short-subunit alcohol dehydrogenase family)